MQCMSVLAVFFVKVDITLNIFFSFTWYIFTALGLCGRMFPIAQELKELFLPTESIMFKSSK